LTVTDHTPSVPPTTGAAPEAPEAHEAPAAGDDVPALPFPTGFVWGVSTAAYQIEGSVDADGRGRSIWDTFSHAPGAVAGGDTGDVACDHYRRYADDVALLHELGIPAYRFSIAWPRVQPGGRGPVNAAGLDFYDGLVDELLRYEITPLVTLYHWDLPQELQDAGGWAERATAERFADYAEIVAGRLGDRVRRWTTLNEPWCSAYVGYAKGEHAPGIRDPRQALRAVHHLLLGHGLAVRRLRAALPASAEISIVLNPAAVRPATDSEADAAAAQAIDGIANRIFLDPLFRGRYPDDIVTATRAAGVSDWSYVQPGDLEIINAPLDALGVNFYSPMVVEAGTPPVEQTEALLPFPACPGVRLVDLPLPRTGQGWPVDATALAPLLRRMSDAAPGIPLLVTENGAAYPDHPGLDGVADPDRVKYLHAHLAAVHEAISSGVDVRGYFLWSFLDNFEWAWGYTQRFGLVYVDYVTQDRIPKDSATWYRDLIHRHGLAAAVS
jgi:beta-glucosidase